MKRSEALHRTYDMLLDMCDERTLSSRLKKIIVRPEWNVLVAEDGLCGMVINFYGKYSIEPDKSPQVDEFRSAIGLGLTDVVDRYIDATDPNLRSLAVCSLSCLSQPFLNDDSSRERGLGAVEDIVSLVRPDDRVAVVGYGLMVNVLKKVCREVHVTEMRPRHFIDSIVIDGDTHYYPDDVHFHSHLENEDVLGSSDVVFITASTLVNGTFDELLGYCGNTRLCGIYGPSGSILPDALFGMGLDFTRAYEITDPDVFVRDALDSPALESSIKKQQKKHWILRS